ncbi:MAG TPA: GAF domain-containing protein [Trebonia sp.]|jgi:hypothetical protein
MGPLGDIEMSGYMSPPVVPRPRSADLRLLAADARSRAERAAGLRAMFEARAAEGPDRRTGQSQGTPQVLMEAVAETLGVSGVVAALYARGGRAPILVAASDMTSQEACEIEATAGQGPVTTTMAAGVPVHVTGAELARRWPRYSRAAARLGIGTVTAVPLQLPVVRLGALCCYQAWPVGEDIVGEAQTLAAALTPILLRATPASGLPS